MSVNADGGPRLEASAVAAGYNGSPVVSDISLGVRDGEVVSILGPNGCGKSTFLKALVGVIRPLGGSVALGGRLITGLASEEIARLGLGYVPQVNDIFEPMSVAENLEMGGFLLKAESVPERVDEVLVQLPRLRSLLDRRAGKLSGGERKLLGIGRALMARPQVLVLDEPTANLAPRVAAELLEVHVRSIAASGAAVLMVEQRVRLALAVSDWTHVFGRGRVVLAGTAAEVADDPEFVRTFLGGRRSVEEAPEPSGH